MITIGLLRQAVVGLDELALEQWIARRWVRPQEASDGYRFDEIDVARVRLILLLHELEVGEQAMPVILSLLDQLHAARRQMLSVAAELP